MRILTIDTALQGCAVGLYDSVSDVITEDMLKMERGQAEHLVPMIEEITKGDYKGIDLIAVSQGPGAFAGLRIGLMCAKTLSMVLSIPVVGVPTLQAMQKASEKNAGVVLIETKRADYYVQIEKQEPACLSAVEVMSAIKGKGHTIVGNANDRFKMEIREIEDIRFETIEMIPPKILAMIALETFTKSPDSIDSNPIYLRAPEIGTPKRAPRKIKS